MNINVTFRNMDPSDTLREYVEQRFKKLKKYADGPMNVNVVLSIEKFRRTAEVVISGDRLRAAAKEEQNDFNSAIDLLSDKIEKQLKKYREKIKSRRGSRSALEAPQVTEEASAEGTREFQVIASEPMASKPMSVEEAVAQLQLLDQDFLVFNNSDNNAVNVLYWRKDGVLGLIEPV